MRTRSKKTTDSVAVTPAMERSRRLRQTSPEKSPRDVKKKTTSQSSEAGALEIVLPVHEVVRFEFAAPSAREVFVAGTFNNWKCGATPMTRLGDGKWSVDITLHPGVHEYRFVVDGEWKLDPNNTESVPNPFGEANSVLIIGH